MDLMTRFSLKNAAVVVIAAILITAGGLWSGGQLKRETMPDVTIPIVAVITPYPGAAPADVYDKVSEPLEQAIAGVDGIKNTNSVSSDSVSVIVAEFSYSADMDQAEASVLKAIDMVDLPENVLDTTTRRVSMGSQPVLRFAVAGGDSPEEIQAAVRDALLPALEGVDGVGEVIVSDQHDADVRVVFDEKKLEDAGLTTDSVVQQLQAANLSFPVGSLEIDQVDQPIRVSGGFADVDAIRDFQVVVYPDSNAMFADAFAAIGEGMGALGGAVGQLGSGMGQLGGAVGDIGAGMGDLASGMGEMGQSLGMQLGLSAALQDVQAQSLDAKIQLSSTQSIMRDLESAGATATPEYMQASMAVAQLEAVIPALDSAATSIKAQLAAAQSAAAQLAPPASGGGSVPSSPQMSMPSGGASADFDTDMEMAEPELELVALRDVAEVTYGAGEQVVYSRANDAPAVLIDVVKTQEANTVDIVKALHVAIDDSMDGLPADTAITYTYDGSDQINKSIEDMIQEGLLGALFAFIVILVFLRNIRSTLISAVSIPLSIVLALLFMRLMGVTMNVMTLGGLTVAIGRVVDDSIVVIENIYNHLQAGGEPGVALIKRATAEVSSAITSSTLTTVAVFAPMMLVSGVVGKIFTPFALTVAVALLASLLVSLTIVPLLAKWSLLSVKVTPRDEGATRTGLAYRKALTWSLDHPGIVISTATLIFVASLGLASIVGMGFMPPSTEPYLNVDVEYPAGFTAKDVDDALRVVEAEFAENPNIAFYTATVEVSTGFNMAQGGVTGGNKGHVFAKLSEDADLDVELAAIYAATDSLVANGAKVTAAQVDMSGTSANALEIYVIGSPEEIDEAVPLITAGLEGIDGLENVSSNLSEKRPQIIAEVDQAKAAEYGLNAAMVAMTIRGYVAEQSAGFTEIDGMDAEIIYVTALDELDAAEDLAGRPLATPLGEEIEIRDVATVEVVDTATSVLTYNESEYASVTGSITERDTSTVIQAAELKIDELDLPSGVEVSVGGVAQMMSDSFEQLGIAMIVAIFAVYLVMVLTFGEAIAPLTIMFSLPLAVVGGLLGLFITGLPLDMPAMIGALMLIGIVTTNAIMFVERVHQRMGEGMPRREALLDAGTNRMRPILMTALTTIMALIPMASGFKSGALMSQSLAVVVVGGLTASTALTLIVVPVIYDLLEALKERVLAAVGIKVEPEGADV